MPATALTRIEAEIIPASSINPAPMMPGWITSGLPPDAPTPSASAVRSTGSTPPPASSPHAPDLGPAGRGIYKACGNRRTSACPSCADTYRRDAFQLIRAGLVGGKGIPDTSPPIRLCSPPSPPPPSAPSTRGPRRTPVPVRPTARCQPQPATPAVTPSLPARPHAGLLHPPPPETTRLGQPLCPDCYDHTAHVVWNNTAGELWRRTKHAIERHLNQLARHRHLPYGVRVRHGKAAEDQARGAVHFHALLRLDGLDPTDPPGCFPRRPA